MAVADVGCGRGSASRMAWPATDSVAAPLPATTNVYSSVNDGTTSPSHTAE